MRRPEKANRLCICILMFIVVGCYKKREAVVVWVRDMPVIGSQSSPRATDLNGDGVLDIVIGAGRNEFEKSPQGILAFDGASGKTLWQQETVDQVYGTPALFDVTQDGVADVFIGGRGPHFKAIDGATGKLLWEYKYSFQNDSILKHARFNFNNALIVPDQDGDGLSDILTVNGGNALADPHTEVNRYPGVMMIMNSKNGSIIAADTMPDGRESYMSPIMFRQPGEDDINIIFGTGGETIDGHLYKVKLADVKSGTLKNAVRLASENGHGFIAPASAADITGDGIIDIICISHGSSIFAIDGASDNILWTQRIPGTESSNSLAVGYFNNDDVPDFFTFVSKGEWPNSTGSVQIMLDGKDGNIAFKDSIGCTGYSSPVVYDLNDDGRDDVIISINEYDCSIGYAGKNPATMRNKLISIDFSNNAWEVLDQMESFKNIFTTPWLGDLDGDGYLDLIECQYFNQGPLLSFLGMRIKRINTGVPVKNPVLWGAYMGSDGDGWYKK